jgi:hypothetical protein
MPPVGFEPTISVGERPQTEVTECLLSLGTESFVFQFAIQEYKDKGIQIYSIPVVL